MRSLLLKGITAVLFAVALAPLAKAQVQNDIVLIPRRVGSRAIQSAPAFAYDNTTFYQGFVYSPGGATLIGANTITELVADDITFAPGQGNKAITQIYFALSNRNATPVAARPRMRFWFPDGTGGVPGTYYNNPANVGYTFNFGPTFMIPTGVSFWFTDITAGQFNVPAAGQMWAGMTFDNNIGAAGYATAAELDNLGVALSNPPVAGSSQDLMFQTTAAGSFFNIANPPGATFTFGNATDPAAPVASMQWGFTVTGTALAGTVNLEGAVDKAQPITFEFRVGGVTQFSQVVFLNPDGSFGLITEEPNVGVPNFGVLPGTYDIAVKGDKWLREVVTGVDLTGADVLNFAVTLRAGDANNDNAADIVDLLVLISAYNQISPAAGYSAAADFNTDGSNDIVDLLLLIGNYNQLGDS